MTRKTLLICFALLVPLLVPATSLAAPGADPYIVVLKDNVSSSGAVADQHKGRFGARLKHVYRHALKGYAARLPDNRVDDVRADSRVAYVEPDGEMRAFATQSNATWGLDRIDQRPLPLSTSFSYTNTGAGVNAYIIDTGIRFSHSEFAGRAVSGYDAVDGGNADDCNGHGTHVAGTTGGATYGVAKGVKLVGVRVLSCSGSGTTSGVIAGVDWVTGNRITPAVANMSLGGGASTALDTAVKNSIASGVTYAVAAGNGNAGGRAQDACRYSPARVPEALTISATNKTDTKASWANYGNCVDWFAPGVGITSSWKTSDTSTNTISGTSMATPHTAGVAALYLQSFPGASPQQVRGDALANPEPEKNGLYEATTKRIVTSSKTTNNHLLYTGW
jgi:subtilisin family serine protease